MFDPYYQWLGIPPNKQPPNHYTLLGLQLFESDVELIEAAANRQMAYVQRRVDGEHATMSHKVLNKLSAARVCLLNSQKKTAYDAALKMRQVERNPTVAASTSTVAASHDLANSIAKTSPSSSTTAETARLSSSTIANAQTAAATNGSDDLFAFLPAHYTIKTREKKTPWTSWTFPLLGLVVAIVLALSFIRTGWDNTTATSTSVVPALRLQAPRNSNSPSRPTTGFKPDPKPGTQPESEPVPTLDQTPKPEVLPSPEVETPKVDEAKKSEAKSEQEPEELHQEKLPVPDRAVQERVLATVRDLFKGDYKDKAALATKLIHKAKETQDVVGRFVLLNEAKVLAAEAFQGELAIEAIDAMASEYAINGSEMKAAVLERAAKKPRLKPEQKMAIATAALQVIDEATGDDNYEVARKLVELADKVGRLSRNKQLIQDIVTKKEEVESMAKAYDDVAKAMDVLKDRPQDADANLTAGKYLCVVKSRWKKGLPMLALGIDEKLRAAAKMDIAGAASTAEQVKLADLWWDLSKERAAYWYTQALPELDGPEQERVAKRMAQMRGRLTSPNGSNDIRKSMPQSR